MGTLRTCDHCNKPDDGTPVGTVAATTVAITVDGLTVPEQATGISLAADCCSLCRVTAVAKMMATIHKRLEIAAPAHRAAIRNRDLAAEKATQVKSLQNQISTRDNNIATPTELATIEQLNKEAASLEQDAIKALRDSTAKEDAIQPW